ncbi:hypothetical protein JKP88DRAFT_241305 [Tribonema minus]|uniref:Uncharacterized protein n=1 Tax=Tribonema minus TaxID=303371 RepID=A0A836CEQ4_9STRA|nr:hypothetical protein JKP88DRAFT_241305 [Tribonema minus]
MPSFADIDPATIRADNVVILKEGRGTLVKLLLQDGSKVSFQTPPMSLAWDTRVRAQTSGQTSCGLALSFANGNDKCGSFAAWLAAVRVHLVKLVQVHSADWYGKQLTEAQVEEYMGSLVREPPAGSAFSATFIPKVAYLADAMEGSYKMKLHVFDAAGAQLCPEDVLVKDTRCAAIVDLPYIHLGRGNKMISIRADATQVLAIPIVKSDHFAFDVESDPELRAAADSAERKRQDDDATATASPEEGLADPPAAKVARTMQEMADHDGADDV